MLKKDHPKIVGHQRKFHVSALFLFKKKNFYFLQKSDIYEQRKYKIPMYSVSNWCFYLWLEQLSQFDVALNITRSRFSNFYVSSFSKLLEIASILLEHLFLHFPPQFFNYIEFRTLCWPVSQILKIFIHKKTLLYVMCCILKIMSPYL